MKPDLSRPTTDSDSNSGPNLNDDAATVVHEPLTLDIEHMPVVDDPRRWSNFRKNYILLQVAFGSMIAGLAGNIQNPAINEMEVDLPATASQISLSLSLFILLQGVVPLIWASISEVKGRRFVYIMSMAIFTVGSVVVATSKSIGLLIGFRCFQAAGSVPDPSKTEFVIHISCSSSAVMSIGAATLADIFDPVERGTKMGIYYIAPLLGPSLGSISGGGLTTAFTWRGPFYFLAIMGGVVFMSFLLFFSDTFRRERSHTYQSVLKARLKEARTKKNVGVEEIDAAQDIEKQDVLSKPIVTPEVKLGLVDVNPFRPMAFILRRKYNLFMLTASGFYFSFAFVVVYTTSRTLGTYYLYDPLKIGLVLLAYGIGTVGGSIAGGRWSDYQLSKLKVKNEGKSTPEMRLRCTLHGLVIFPLCVVGYAWVLQERVNVAGVSTMLFACGFTSIFVYTSTLAYIVDSNVGRSSSAVALNSCFRGTFAFIFEEIAVPMQDGLGDGWMYTIIAFIMAISGVLIVIVMLNGSRWRREAEESEAASSAS
ncbi:vacuolar DHA amino acid exporter [Lentinula lateritia]|uniref:Vacuolar DHA amino acid exporter n=1 Tax=Lentinula aff. lateritia TaxID=2804960 RepID=A0ACC1TKL5_9AGAR|nr:vacuolar DHA amino acid exporter [Lentinula aff. lateritia]KAJ3848309.1 vacuolar DHA amino acid exporter [Lentinula lateritia]